MSFPLTTGCRKVVASPAYLPPPSYLARSPQALGLFFPHWAPEGLGPPLPPIPITHLSLEGLSLDLMLGKEGRPFHSWATEKASVLQKLLRNWSGVLCPWTAWPCHGNGRHLSYMAAWLKNIEGWSGVISFPNVRSGTLEVFKR